MTPTATKTRVPATSTPKNTPLPACSVDTTILVENNTGGWITLNLNGPAKFSFDLGPGNKNVDVCSGHYTWKAWGCGGASDSGEVNAGSEKLTFQCY